MPSVPRSRSSSRGPLHPLLHHMVTPVSFCTLMSCESFTCHSASSSQPSLVLPFPPAVVADVGWPIHGRSPRLSHFAVAGDGVDDDGDEDEPEALN